MSAHAEKFWRKAVKAAKKKVHTLGDKKLNENLEYACGSLAEAYRVGVEEAQGEIVSRLMELQNKLANESARASMSENDAR